MKVSNAVVLIAVLGCSGAALADDTVKPGGRPDKPGRALGGNAANSGSPTDNQDSELETANRPASPTNTQ